MKKFIDKYVIALSNSKGYTKGKVYKISSTQRMYGHLYLNTYLDDKGSRDNGWGHQNFKILKGSAKIMRILYEVVE